MEEGKRNPFILLLASSLIVAALSYFSATSFSCFADTPQIQLLGVAVCLFVRDVAPLAAPLIWIVLTRIAYRNYRQQWRWLLIGAPFAVGPQLGVLFFIGLCEFRFFLHLGRCNF
jgi:hypothetical protein